MSIEQSADLHPQSSGDRPPDASRSTAYLGIGATLALSVLAVASFHLAYEVPALACLMGVFVFCVCSLAWVRTPRFAFYTGLIIGLAIYGPQLAFFRTIFGAAAVALWAIAAIWLAAFLLISRSALDVLPRRLAMLAMPFTWMGLEYFRSELYYLRFSWLSPGLAFSQTPALMRLGTYGVGFLLVLLTLGGLLIPRRARWPVGVALLLALAAIGYLPKTAGKPDRGSGPVIVGVQLEARGPQQILKELDKALASQPQPNIVVLSEYSFYGPVPEELRRWCREHGLYMVAGGTENAGDDFRNTVYVVGPDGQVIFKQGKSVPIQFFKDGLPAAGQAVWQSPWGRIGFAVCYDLSYSRVIDRLIRLGADALIIPTMDVKSWGMHEHVLHSRIGPARAAEYGVPVVRVCSSGISQIISADGGIASSASFPGQGDEVHAEIAIMAHAGHVPPDRFLAPISVAVTVVVASWVVVAEARRRRSRRKEQ